MKLLGSVLAITVVPLLACGGDDGGDGGTAITWRVPCETRGHWTSDATAGDDVTTFVYDARRHPTHRVTTLADGTVSSTVDQTWDGDRLQTTDYVGRTLNYRSVFTWDGAQIVQVVRTDRTTDDGDDASYVATYHYDGDALIGYDLDWANPVRDDLHTTVTGNRSTRETDVECSVQNPTQCDTSVWEQPDGDPDHWIRGTIDFGSDGVDDLQWERTIDRHGLELTFHELDLASGGPPSYRYVYEREADGTELGHIYESFNSDGTVADSYQVTAVFTCQAARLAGPGAAGGRGRDLVEDAGARGIGWRRDLTSLR